MAFDGIRGAISNKSASEGQQMVGDFLGDAASGVDEAGDFGGTTGKEPFDPNDPSTWSLGAQRANAKYNLNQWGQPGGMEWWLDEANKDKQGGPAWADYGEQSKQMGDAMRQWQIGMMAQPAHARSQQQAGIDTLRNRAQGNDLISQMIAKQQAGALGAAGQSAAASAPGGYNPMMARNAAQQQAGAQQQLAGQAMTSGAMERQAAQDAMMQALSGMRGQDYTGIGAVGDIRGQDLTRGQQDLSRYGVDVDRNLQQQQLKQNMMNMGSDQWKSERMLRMAETQAYKDPTWLEKNAPWLMPAIQGGASMIPYVGKGLSNMIGSQSGAGDDRGSDRNLKEDVRPAGGNIDEFLAALSPSTYRYKDPSAPGSAPGEHTGVMAQDLEKSELGRQLVTDTPQGKMVDYQKAVPMLLAAIVELHRKQKEQGPGQADHVIPPGTDYYSAPGPHGGSVRMGTGRDELTPEGGGWNRIPGLGWSRPEPELPSEPLMPEPEPELQSEGGGWNRIPGLGWSRPELQSEPLMPEEMVAANRAYQPEEIGQGQPNDPRKDDADERARAYWEDEARFAPPPRPISASAKNYWKNRRAMAAGDGSVDPKFKKWYQESQTRHEMRQEHEDFIRALMDME